MTIDEGKMVDVLGEWLICPVCGSDRFEERASLLNTAGMTFLDLDWMNKEAQNFICTRCGYVFWFFERRYVREDAPEQGRRPLKRELKMRKRKAPPPYLG